ncbi:hypothetical protein BCT46_23490 [Vibrio sp. 10N.261.46.E8]|nr:hypothetical protein BH584_12585 [Vibrio sp. 10N.261.45.E1]PMJ26219.1 hypothetical protein BCU27_09700 [Vibrio sp. 10N.286.45.B6]PML82787.1 hypothetical protein BCT66_20065 [Vibrio sp. 10N.261.49.E11]PMM90311.1 hypothetical protein BCT46_23490 [Vibrio sp. 10N.261.46.E8]PMN43931.1 hypothetical protein BCT32_00770 [Vibrio sp. 10N.261.45.E11]PMN93228.1 hypothetical protein BCT22_23815 [Vibrio sp. 10N.261.45.A1]
MALSSLRKKIRIMSLTTAASMIEDYVEQGLDEEAIGLSEEEVGILEEENKKTARMLYTLAKKIEKSGER